MPYYIRLLTPSVEIPPFDELELAIGPDAELTLEAGGPESWDQLLLSLDDGTHVAVIERNPVEGDGSLGAAELAEFGEKIATCRPETSARWLASYLPGVETIYAFQLLSGADTEEGREALDELRGEMWMELGGILQADAEGFIKLNALRMRIAASKGRDLLS